MNKLLGYTFCVMKFIIFFNWRFVFGLTSLLVEENFFDDFAFFSCHKSNPQVMEEDEKDGDIGGELERRERDVIFK